MFVNNILLSLVFSLYGCSSEETETKEEECRVDADCAEGEQCVITHDHEGDDHDHGLKQYRLLSALGMSGSLAHSTGVTFADYSTNSMAIGIECEKIAHLASSGENLSNTSVIQLKIAGFGTQAADLPSRCHLVAQHDCVISIRDTTVEIFE